MSESTTPHDSIAVTAINNTMLMVPSGISPYREIAEIAQQIWTEDGHTVRPQAKEPKVNAPGIEVRYRLANRLLSDAPQIFDIAAGLTPRGVTMASENPSLAYVELDLPVIVDMKRRILRRLMETTPPNWHIEGGTVLEAATVQHAARHLDQRQPVAISTEGLLHYMDRAERALTAKNIISVLRHHPSSMWYTDMPTEEGVTKHDSPMATTTSEQTGRDVPANRFETKAEARAFFEALGLRVVAQHSYVERSLVDSLTSLETVGTSREAFIKINRPWALWELRVAD